MQKERGKGRERRRYLDAVILGSEGRERKREALAVLGMKGKKEEYESSFIGEGKGGEEVLACLRKEALGGERGRGGRRGVSMRE